MPLLRTLDQLFFVPHCPACDQRIEPGQALCPSCAISLYPIGAACPRCAEPLSGPASLLCRRCRRRPPPFAAMVASHRYGGELAIALRRLKFESRSDIARSLAPLYRPQLDAVAPLVDLAIPIPLHRRRLAARGFNQSALLLQRAGADLEIVAPALRRTRATTPQTGLDRQRRAANVAGAFAVSDGFRWRLHDRRILLFDDVMTTGATMTEAARALLAAGAAQVVGFCVARADTTG